MNDRLLAIGLGLCMINSTALAEYHYDGIKPTICDDRLPDQEARVACYLDYTSPNHPDNQPNIPQACQDANYIYQPIRYIYTQTGSYNDRENAILDQPIKYKDGFIKTDFNQDNYADYIFLERNKEDIVIAACLSSGGKYERVATKIGIYEFNPKRYQIGSLEDTTSLASNNQLVIYKGAYEHGTGSYFTEHTYEWDSKSRALVLIQHRENNYSGGGYDVDRNNTYDWKQLRYEEITDCHHTVPDIGCTENTIETGQMRLLGPPPILGPSFYDDQFSKNMGFKTVCESIERYE